ncbi:MAG: DUF1559 domain-containing protein [Chthoniobacterales bacterium]|nr:DUF1559 domain-containing protein [Chthoniobacterales bacterium]
MAEILSVSAIVAILASLVVPGWNRAREQTRAVACVGKLKAIGMGFQLYAQDHEGEFPRSFHSAGAHRESGWSASVAPYLGAPSATTPEEWKLVFNRYFRCPADPATDPSLFSYGLNVFYELTPDGDDYEGSPATWRRLLQVPHPSKTTLLAETRPIPYADHFMCHQWSGKSAARQVVDAERHSKKSNYLFADGHVAVHALEEIFNPDNHINRWNPSIAR